MREDGLINCWQDYLDLPEWIVQDWLLVNQAQADAQRLSQ